MRTNLIACTWRRCSGTQLRRHYRSGGAPKLSPNDVNLMLRQNEITKNFTDAGPLSSYDSNLVPSNSPTEDSRTEGSFLHGDGILAGVFDGHAGSSCSQVTSKRLLRYLAASLTDPDTFRDQILNHNAQSFSFLKCHNDELEFIPEVRGIYERSFRRFAMDLIEKHRHQERHIDGDKLMSAAEGGKAIENIMIDTFLRLDQDFTEEAQNQPCQRTLGVAMSGCVSCVAYVAGNDLRVANVGDCSAVLGSLNEAGQWVAKKMVTEHNAENMAEVRRIISEHPANERETVIRMERLLGQLAPLRALGDVRYKWARKELEATIVPLFGANAIAPYYFTPPYLSAEPEVHQHTLTAKDQFLVLATDGLWDLLSPLQVVRLVGEHMNGKVFLKPLELPDRKITLGELQQLLAYRKIGMTKKPLDRNSATHLIRNALGGTDYGVEHSKLSHILSLPKDVVRLYRDDITVTVLYFNGDYLQNMSAGG